MTINSIFKGRYKQIHLVGIGGIGMSGIARILLASGFVVSGSDIKESRETLSLKKQGASIFIGHDESNICGADVLVYSSAIKADNIELIAAQKKSLPIIPRSLMLAELMRLRCGIAVAGSHGKTTTTSLIGTLMNKAGLDPSIIIGGIVNHFDSNAVVGQSQFMVTEADESDGTFLHLSPTIAVVTNIDQEHLDFYPGGIEEIRDNFAKFLNNIPFYGLVVACIDDENVALVINKLNKRISSYGLSKDAHYRAKNIECNALKTRFQLVVKGQSHGHFTINLPGHHNVLNTLAAIATMSELGIPPRQLEKVLEEFHGIDRRFTRIKSPGEITIIDDYAHHPTEIKAVLKAARESFVHKKIRVLFQPHRFSRTKDLWHDFSRCFHDCDSLVITDIYSAQEQPIAGINSENLVKEINKQSLAKAIHKSDLDDGSKTIAALTEENDVVLTLGAGSITNAGSKIVSLLSKKLGINL